jgi:hypothetical protein
MIVSKHTVTKPEKKPDMNSAVIVLAGILVLGIFFAGCTQTSGTVPVTAAAPVTTPAPTGAVTVAATSTPEPVVTIIHYVSQVRDIKDSELLFALQVPVEWNVSTRRLDNPDNSGGLMYQTDLVGNDEFTIRTYSISNSQDQAFRDEFRKWIPAPLETTVKINDITYDRFESTSDGKTRVAYVARKTSANERGYASVLFFTANTSNQFEKSDFEKVVSSFRYPIGSSVKTTPGEEIPKFSSSGESLKSKQSLPVKDNTTGICRCKLGLS